MGEMISFRIGEELDDELQKLAEEEGEEKSALIRELIARGIEEKKIDHAVEAYQKGKVSLWKAARLAGLSLWKMMDILKARKIEVHYSETDLTEDLKALKK